MTTKNLIFSAILFLITFTSQAGTNSRTVDLDDKYQCLVASKGAYRAIDAIHMESEGDKFVIKVEFEGEGYDLWGEGDFVVGPINLETKQQINDIVHPVWGPPFQKMDHSQASIMAMLKLLESNTKLFKNCGTVGGKAAGLGKTIHDGKRDHGKSVDHSNGSSRKSRNDRQR